MSSDNDIAIVGMAARLPGARTVQQYWKNLRGGVESVRSFSDEELIDAGVKREVLRRPNYVRSGAPLDKMEYFDAEFFGFSPKEAAILDPQHRHFLETCWEALEDAGHPPETFSGAVGVFAGCGMGSYFMFNLLTNPELVKNVGLFLLRHTGNDKDFLSTRVSYLLGLRGPSLNIQTACSTSLVATHLACQHLLSGECDMALAGGVTIEIPHRRGYHYEEGEILSPDGHCRAFDHRSQGTIFGSGAGVVVLRRLQDALDDNDVIHAVIKGTAVNNDGSQKVGYLAPSVDGQAACVAEALAVANVEPENVSYIECHGTGTPMGDPIEVSALSQAFRESTDKKQFCGIGSVKTNIGHLDTAAGVASLIKVSLALENGELPPSLNWEKNNPNIDFESSPFFVNHKLRPWQNAGKPRVAAVNSLGVGGTNAFAILEEAPARAAAKKSQRPFQLLALSGRSRAALDDNTKNLAKHLREQLDAGTDVDLADVAWTLQVGRRHFGERRVLAAKDAKEAVALLESLDPKRVFHHTASAEKQSIAFLFPGGGAQYPRMAKDIYDAEPVFRQHMEAGLALLKDKHGVDLAQHLFCDESAVEKAGVELEKPSLQLPAIFLVEYALAQLLMSWDIQPTALMGHSLGENTAACVSGTMRFEECLGLVVLRGRLMDSVSGGMLVVPLPPNELVPLLDEFGLDLATVNAPELCVASGSLPKLSQLDDKLKARGVEATRIKINIAAHSRELQPILAEFGAYLKTMSLQAPGIPWVSNRTGTWITPEQAKSPDYWVQHLRHSVLFAEGVQTLAADSGRVFLEVGPGKTLSSLSRMHPAVKAGQACLPCLRHPEDKVSDVAMLLTLRGRLWAVGGPLETDKLFTGPDGKREERRRVTLPTYAFQGQRYFIEPGERKAEEKDSASFLDKEPELDRWFWETTWKRRDADDPVTDKLSWLVFMDETGVGRRLVERLRRRGEDVVVVKDGDSYQRLSDDEYRLAAEHGRTGYDNLMRDLVRTSRVPDRVVHLSLLADEERFRPGSSFFHRNQELGFYSLLFFAQAWAAEGLKRTLHVVVGTCGMQKVKDGDEVRWPEQATVLGPVRVMPRELPGVTVSCIDLDLLDLTRPRTARERVGELLATLEDSPARDLVATVKTRTPRVWRTAEARTPLDGVVDALEADIRAPATSSVVAHRGAVRYVQELRRATVKAVDTKPLREGAVVFVTGGLGGIGLAVASHLVTTVKARLALLSREPLPARGEWSRVQAKLGPEHPISQRIARVKQLEEGGAEVLLVHGDVTDVERMNAVTAQVRERFGAIHAVIHAAGALKDDLLATKTQADVEEVLAPKVYGTLVMDGATRRDSLELFVVFSSTSTATAPAGQVDYVAANAFLNAFAHARRGPGRTLSINWGVWNEVGMAADQASRMLGNKAVAPGSTPCAHPLLNHKSTDAKGVTTLHARYAPDQQWVLDEHRTRDGEALMPGAGYLELARAALAEIGLLRPFEMRDLTFFRPLYVKDGEVGEVRYRLTPNEQGYLFETHEKVVLEGATAEGGATKGRTGWRKTAQARLWLHEQPAQPTVDVPAAQARCTRRGPARSRQEDHLRFGPRWGVVQQAHFGAGEAIAALRLPDAFDADLHEIALHPALVDLGTGFAMELIPGYSGDTLWVPVSYRSVRIWGALPKTLTSLVRVREGTSQAAGFAHFDVQLIDEAGRVLVEVEELTIKRLDGKLDLGIGRRVLPGDVELDADARTDRQLSPAELSFQHNLRQGILPTEGAAAFARAVSSWRRPQLFVSSLNLQGLMQQAEAAAEALSAPAQTEPGARFSRPQLGSEYVAARDDIEKTLVEYWEDLLGVSPVGVQDSFFDLGGHSLIAVRLFSKVKKAFSVEFPMSVLFEAPTIEACARLISSALPNQEGQRGADTAASPAPEQATRPRYTHLVAMQPGEGGPRTPFFLVAGMFGNVLNLRHLANQIGTDRPFYGLQARGLYGGDQPHETFEELARDYLAELRLVQPHGPYCLGGFSGGGIAAIEMAQQLRDAGEEVALLVLLDTPLPQGEILSARDKVEMHLQNLQRRGAGYVADWAKSRVDWELRRWRRKESGDQQEGAFHSQAIEAAFYRAIARYHVKHYEGTITLFRPKLNPIHVFGPDRQINKDKRFIYHDNGWGRFCDHVEVYEVPGDHDGMVLEPNVRVLAARLRASLLEAEQRYQPSNVVPLPARDAAE